MGVRIHLFECLDCIEKYGDDPDVEREDIAAGFKTPPHFYERMEHMTKEELLEHIEDIECHHCGSENWRITDYSQI